MNREQVVAMEVARRLRERNSALDNAAAKLIEGYVESEQIIIDTAKVLAETVALLVEP